MPIPESDPKQNSARKCDYCGNDRGQISYYAFGDPTSDDVQNAWLHLDCERAYRRLIEPPA